MKIAHIITGLNVGGAELMLKRLLLSVSSCSRSEVIVISLTDIGQIGEELCREGFTVFALNINKSWLAPMGFFKLIYLIRKNKPGIVQTWLYHSDLLGGIAAKLAGVRHIIWGIRTTDLKKGSYITACIRCICSVLSYVIPSVIVSAAYASKSKHIALGYCAKKMVVIHNGFDFSMLQASHFQRVSLRSAYGIDESHIVIGCLGRFVQVKAPDVFVAAAALVAKKIPNSRFLMVGRGLDSSNSELMAWINSTGIADRFILLGQRQDVAVCLSAMDVFCLPSRNEGFPNALGEAMAMGLPCVATCAGDAELLLSDTGLLVAKPEPEVLALRLIEVLEKSLDERVLMGERAANRVREEFSITKSVVRFDNLYNSLL